MNGVTIINSTDIYGIASWQYIIGLLPFIISAVIVLYQLYKSIKKRTPEQKEANMCDFNFKYLLVMFICWLCSFALVAFLDKCCPASYVSTQYEIEIADSASFNEVYNKYSIIAEKENTFIVVEREKS